MSKTWTALPECPIPPLQIPTGRVVGELEVLCQAADNEQAAMRSLSRGGLNVIGEILKGQGTFYEMNHYPEDDVFDDQSHAQYYYHAHREAEHGHFHTFIRRAAIPANIQPASGFKRSEPLPQAADELAHLICISMNKDGLPIGLFATNRWVTDESWYSAEETISLVDQFRIEHASPNLAVNQWLTNFMRLCRPQIELLLRHRDQIIGAWQNKHPERDVLEDRSLEITGYLPIDVPQWVSALKDS
ncbi:MAG: hypothetical protein ACJAWL_003321 [Motiliproteus sp.]|jgi:hypothetical protein